MRHNKAVEVKALAVASMRRVDVAVKAAFYSRLRCCGLDV
jgi:hypothetical protein